MRFSHLEKLEIREDFLLRIQKENIEFEATANGTVEFCSTDDTDATAEEIVSIIRVE
jgi:hypothetical protein